MINPFEVWAPSFRAPFSGDVTQEIVPRVFSPDIKGNAEIEQRVQTEVASYGKQLGKILEALQVLSNATKTGLPEIDNLVTEIDAIKSDNKDKIRADAEAALMKLKSIDEDAWKQLVNAA